MSIIFHKYMIQWVWEYPSNLCRISFETSAEIPPSGLTLLSPRSRWEHLVAGRVEIKKTSLCWGYIVNFSLQSSSKSQLLKVLGSIRLWHSTDLFSSFEGDYWYLCYKIVVVHILYRDGNVSKGQSISMNAWKTSTMDWAMWNVYNRYPIFLKVRVCTLTCSSPRFTT